MYTKMLAGNALSGKGKQKVRWFSHFPKNKLLRN